MRILITGVAGFIGNNLAEYLTSHGNEVVGIWHNRKPKCKIYKLIKCDLAKDNITDCINGEKVDAVIHLAGQMGGKYICDYLDNTVVATRNLIQFTERHKIEKMIYLSSISVYGETFSDVNENSDRINPDDYGITKYICERMMEDSHIKSRIVIRLPRTLGKECDLSYPWLPMVAGKMLRNEPVYYTNPQLMYNNLLYVDDLSQFILRLLENGWNRFERFVLGAEGKLSVLQILQCMKKNLASSSELIVQSGNGKNKCFAIDSVRAKQAGFVSRSAEKVLESFCMDLQRG